MGKIKSTFSAIGKSWKSKPTSKKIYAYLWMLTGVLLAVLIGMFVGLSKTSAVKDETNAKWQMSEKLVESKELKFNDKNNDAKYDAGELTVDGKEVTSIVVNGTNVELANLTKTQYDAAYQISTRVNATKLTADKIELVPVGFDFNAKPSVAPSANDIKYWDAVAATKNTNDIYKFANPDEIKPFVDDQKTLTNVNYAKYNGTKTGVYLKDGSFTVLDGHYSYDFAKTKNGAAIWGNDIDGTLPLTAKAVTQQNAIAAIGGLFAVSIAAAIFTTAGVEYVSKKKKTGGKK